MYSCNRKVQVKCTCFLLSLPSLSPFLLLPPTPPSNTPLFNCLPPPSPSFPDSTPLFFNCYPLLPLSPTSPSPSFPLFLKVNGAGALVWEAVSVLNGAHLSPSGRLGNLVRKYHQNVTSAANTTTTTVEASGKQEVHPLQRIIVLVVVLCSVMGEQLKYSGFQLLSNLPCSVWDATEHAVKFHLISYYTEA